MKKLMTTVAVLGCAVAIVSAQTVTSANMVGYTKVDVTAGQLALAAVNFDTGGALLSELVPTGTLASGSWVYRWDKIGGGYSSSSVNARGNWTADFAIELGDALWIDPANTTSVLFYGEVLTTDASVPVPAAVYATAFYFPVSQDLATTDLGAALANGSWIHVWDGAGYNSISKNARGNWTASAVVGHSQGFWVDNAGNATNITETIPFTP